MGGTIQEVDGVKVVRNGSGHLAVIYQLEFTLPMTWAISCGSCQSIERYRILRVKGVGIARHGNYTAYADTPEDTACKLAIL